MILTQKKPEFIGFNGPEATYVIIWKLLDKCLTKTVCFSTEELEEQLQLHAWKFDGYEVKTNATKNF
ncbi:hypothetical protein [Listeria seeligeri]|uniref:hypothetical protein n=1 Tax=Listeria seeligeri TaxID=1640 RepID=UPI0010CFF7C4|nr:hypothetical protein [Listeria seeligeri]EAD3672182.1 hypothetical protein [Listeria monocytogenes]MBF2544080.1 hypothetical protein [Listeria seeligeri]